MAKHCVECDDRLEMDEIDHQIFEVFVCRIEQALIILGGQILDVLRRRFQCGAQTRLGRKVLGDGRKVRICRKCEGVVDK